MATRGKGLGVLTGGAPDVGDRRRGARRARLTQGGPFLRRKTPGAACTERSNSEGARPSRRLHGGSGGSPPPCSGDEDRRPSPLPPAPLLLLLLFLYLSISITLSLCFLLFFSLFFLPFFFSALLLVSGKGKGGVWWCGLRSVSGGCALRVSGGGSFKANGHGALCSSKLPSEALGWAGDNAMDVGEISLLVVGQGGWSTEEGEGTRGHGNTRVWQVRER